MSETALYTRILKLIRKSGGVAEKIHGDGFNRIGTPDILACVRGRYVAIETKSKGERATPAQERYLREVRQAGGIGAVVYDSNVVARALERDFLGCCAKCLGVIINKGSEDEGGHVGGCS